MTRRERRWLIAVGAAALGLAALHVVWLARFRWGFVTELDEAGYTVIALHDYDAFGQGPGSFARAAIYTYGTQPPLVPLSAVPLLAILGRSVDVAQLVVVPWFLGLVFAGYGLARRLAPARWAALAALVVGTAPVVTDYSRLVHFAVPAAALFTAALWALLRSEGLRRWRWALAGGALLGLTVLARTMTVAYLPAVALALVVPLLVDPAQRRVRLRNLVVVGASAALVAALWWGPNWARVTGYLTGAGYGESARSFGAEHGITELRYWTKEATLVGDYLGLPLAAVTVLVLLAAGLAVARRGSGSGAWSARVRAALAGDWVLPALVVVGGYLALTSTSNQGTAFALPWLPALFALVAAALAGLRPPILRTGLAVLLLAVCGFSVLVKNGVSTALSTPRTAALPLLGKITVMDGRDPAYVGVSRPGAPVRPPPARLPDRQRAWVTFDQDVARWVARAAGAGGVAPVLGTATDDGSSNANQLTLAGVVVTHRLTPVEQLPFLGVRDDVAAYRAWIREAGIDFLLTGDPPRGAFLPPTRRLVERAARGEGFRPLAELTVPDGRGATLWIKGR